jgi:hypothetical protein
VFSPSIVESQSIVTDISIQFHAILIDEIMPIVKSSVGEFRLQVTSFAWPPFSASLVPPERLDLVAEDESIYALALTLGEPVLPAESSGKFHDRNPDAVLLELGRLGSKGLKESGLSVRTTNSEALRVGRSIAKRIRGLTKAGAVAINPTTGEKAFLRSHRYSTGAAALQASGVKMLPLAGTSELHFG